MDLLDTLLKQYILRIKQNSAFMLETLDKAVAQETIEAGETTLIDALLHVSQSEAIEQAAKESPMIRPHIAPSGKKLSRLSAAAPRD